jgi:hypothetical protein
MYEELEANSALKCSVFGHIFVILATVAIIVLDMNLVSAYRRDDPDSLNINFALLRFKINFEVHKRVFKYYCFVRDDEYNKPNSNNICSLISECTRSNVETHYLVESYDLTCDTFYFFGIIGLIVRKLFC